MASGFCTKCGNSLKEGQEFCPKCGAPVAASKPAPTSKPGGSFLGRHRTTIVVAVLVLVVLVAGLSYLEFVYLPSQNKVRTGGGSWLVDDSSGVGVNVGCTDCGQQVAPNSQFTIDVEVVVVSASCGFFGCPSATVESISVNAPYTVVSVSPNNIPYSITEGTGYTWALTVQAPPTAGHFGVGGVVETD